MKTKNQAAEIKKNDIRFVNMNKRKKLKELPKGTVAVSA
jgi:hypothetical protein